MTNIVIASNKSLEGELMSRITPVCPFYGLMACIGTAQVGLLIQSLSKSSCALNGPCTMKNSGKDPSWDNCTDKNNESNAPRIKEIVTNYNAVPDVIRPSGLSPFEWSGISANEWYKIVMGREYS